MPRSLFDASRMTGPPEPTGDGEDRAWTVTQLGTRIDESLRAGLPTRLRVVGEVSQPNNRSHWYFTLKDDHAAISCVMFASDARKSPATPEHGVRFVATGSVQHYPKQGRTQLYVERLEQVGTGALEARLRALIDELRTEGYFDDDRKKPLPAFPRRIAVVTSRTGAALQDVLDTMRRRCPGVGVLVVDTRVQGDGAGERIARIVKNLDVQAGELGLDALLITRGGGSLEDLWCFNDRTLADAISACSLPVVCAIGHETDTTVCELVADRRCATPTQAAMALTPDANAMREQLAFLSGRLRRGASRLVSTAHRDVRRASEDLVDADPVAAARARLHAGVHTLRSTTFAQRTRRALRLERLATRLATHRPESTHAERLREVQRAGSRLRGAMLRRTDNARLDRAQQALIAGVRRDLADRNAGVDTLERELVLVSPASVLARGYSLTTDAKTGAVLRAPGDAPPGTALNTRLAEGTVTSRVEGEGHSLAPSSPAHLPPRRRKKRESPGQMGLF